MHIWQASKPFHLINYVYVCFISLLESLSSRRSLGHERRPEVTRASMNILRMCLRSWGQVADAILTQSSSAHVEEKDQELWGTLEQDCLWLVSAKNSKGVSDLSIQVCMRAVERAACLACERWSKQDRPVGYSGRFLISAIPRQHLPDWLGRITGFSNFK